MLSTLALVLLSVVAAFVLAVYALAVPVLWNGLREVFLPRRKPRQTMADIRAKHDQLIAAAMAIEPEPEHQIVLWTPQEREAFGHNDLARFIEETDRTLKQIEWERLGRPMSQRVFSNGGWTTTTESATRLQPGGPVLSAGRILAGSITADRITLGSEGVHYEGAFTPPQEMEVVEVHAHGQIEPIMRVQQHYNAVALRALEGRR